MRSVSHDGPALRSAVLRGCPTRPGHGKAALLLAAVDGAAGARRKLRSLARKLPLVCVLRAAEIGAAFGREHVVNASLGAGPLCGRLIADAEKIAGFRADAVVERAEQPIPGGMARQDDGIGAR